MVLCILQEEIAAHLCSALVYDTVHPCFRATSGGDLFGVFNLIMAIYIDFFAVLEKHWWGEHIIDFFAVACDTVEAYGKARQLR